MCPELANRSTVEILVKQKTVRRRDQTGGLSHSQKLQDLHSGCNGGRVVIMMVKFDVGHSSYMGTRI